MLVESTAEVAFCQRSRLRGSGHEGSEVEATCISTGPVEDQSLVTEKIRRVAHGTGNFDHCRLQPLLHSGVKEDTRPPARIRGRHQRLAA